MGNPVFDLGGTQSGTPTNITYASSENYAQQAPVKTTYTNFQELFDDNGNAKDGIQLNSNNLINKDWLESKYYELIRRGGLEFNNENLKYLKNLGKAALNYQKYFSDGNPISGMSPKKAYNAQKEFERARKLVLDWSQSLKQKKYKVDKDGNPILVYEGAEGFNDGYETADAAKAAYQKQQQYNKDARAWAGKNYMEDEDYWNEVTGYDGISDNHANNIRKLAEIAGITDEDLIAKAIAGNNWGSKSNEIFQRAVDKLAQTNYKEAKKLYNTINEMYYGKNHKGNVFNNTTLYNGTGAFTNTNKRNWLESRAGVNDVDEFYNKYTVKGENKAGYNDDYQKYVENQKEKAEWERQNSGYGAYYGTQFKQGGKMNKYQQGGQAPTAAQMVLQALSAAQQGDQRGLQQLFSDKETAQAVIQQLQKEAQEGSEEAIQALEALKQLMGGDKKQAPMAQKGAKIAYIHRLSTGCPEGTELKYFKRGGQLCKACVKKAKKAKEGESLDSIIAKNKRRYPGITDDQAAGRAPIRKNGKDYYLGGDGVLSEASKKGKYGFGGFFEYFKCGGKSKKSKCGTKAKCGAELAKCGAELEKCGGKAKKSKCGMKAEYGAEFEKCGGKAKKPKCGTKAKCGAELAKCGLKTTLAKCGTKAQEGAELEKCGGKAKRKRYFC